MTSLYASHRVAGWCSTAGILAHRRGACPGRRWCVGSHTKIVPTILEGGDGVGQLIMLGTLFGLIALVYWLVLRFDPEARRAEPGEGDRWTKG
jgi:hypothetical protein